MHSGATAKLWPAPAALRLRRTSVGVMMHPNGNPASVSMPTYLYPTNFAAAAHTASVVIFEYPHGQTLVPYSFASYGAEPTDT
jgi:hypothetical protein